MLHYRVRMVEPIHLPSRADRSAALERAGHNVFNLDSEDDNAYFQRCFDTVDPIDSTFEDIARTVYGPIIDSERKP